MNVNQMVEALGGIKLWSMPRDQLVVGKFYKGEGRFIGNIGLWDGEFFHGFSFKFGHYMNTTAEYGDRGFSPREELK